MLEVGKNNLRLVRDNIDNVHVYLVVEEAMQSLYSLQLALENKLLSEGETDGK